MYGRGEPSRYGDYFALYIRVRAIEFPRHSRDFRQLSKLPSAGDSFIVALLSILSARLHMTTETAKAAHDSYE